MNTDALFSKCRKYRYSLWRTWDETKPHAMFIGLNPSTADETNNDPTITRCINYSKSWGYGGLCMVNLFAYRATKPTVMMAYDKPIGPDNDDLIKELSTKAGVIVAAWGNDGSFKGRSKKMIKMIPGLMCLKINKSGEPAHPLYQPGHAIPIKMSAQ
jgi:hypothetical protein